MPRHTASQR